MTPNTRNSESKIALITGATSGIGASCAKIFAQNGYNLILTGRRKDRLTKLEDELTNQYTAKVLTLQFDVRNNDEVVAHLSTLPDEWKNIDVLINNAGLAVGLNPIQEGILDDWNRMIDTNVKGLLYVTRSILPMMIARKKGHIINIASIAGKETYAKGNVYCATKSAVDVLSKAIRIDAIPYGIKVTNVAPGAVETEFSIVRFKGNQTMADNVYKGFIPLTGDDIADAVYYCASLPAHVNINDFTIVPTAQASATCFHKEL